VVSAATVIASAAACGIDAVGTAPLGVDADASSSSSSGGSSSGGSAAANDGASDANADVDADASCNADLQTDPKHCGRCGHDCLGGACAAGACQPFVFAANEAQVTGIEVVGNDLVWTRPTAGLVRIMPLDGSAAPRTLINGPAIGLTFPAGVTDFGASLFITDRSSGTISKFTRDGGLVWKQGTFSTPTGIATDGTAIFFAVQEQDGIRSIPMDGGDAASRMTGLNFPYGVALGGGGRIFAASASGILSAPQDSGVPVVTVSPTARFQDGGGDLTHVGIAVDDGKVFFTVQPLGIVASVPVGGGTATILASGQASPFGLDVSPTAIYWANFDSSTIMKLAR
jgi:hypothetical protein